MATASSTMQFGYGVPHSSPYGMPQSSHYGFQQAPVKSQDESPESGINVYDEVETDKNKRHGFVCGIAVIPAAYLVCALMIFEGLFVLLHGSFHLVRVGPFKQSETGFLEFVAYVDIIVAIVGALGIWFGHNLLPVGWRTISKFHSTIAMVGAGMLFGWRSLVCLCFPPWVGILLAFSPPPKATLWAFAVCYLVLSLIVAYILLLAFRQVVSTSKRFQQHLDAQVLGERKQLLFNAHMARGDDFHADGEAMHEHDVEPHVFGVLPLAQSVTLYAIIMGIVCLWAFFHLAITGQTFGGWAFFAGTPVVNITFWLEIILYVLSLGFAIAGFLGAASFSGVGFVREEPATLCVLAFLVGSMARFALLFSVTGMDLLEKDTCGLYVHGLANIAYKSPSSAASGFGLHCQPIDFLFLLGVVVFCIMDAHLIWATYELWHHSQEWVFHPIGKGASIEDNKQEYS